MKLILILNLVFISNVELISNTYRAAVLEHHPTKSQNVYADFSNNLRYYLEQLEQADYQDVDIIVFPECGLTGWIVDPKDFSYVSTVVPDPESAISPCVERSENYTNFLIELSCACKRHQIYAIINLIEVVNENGGNKIYHNTNIALDRSGIVVARYRKINLYDEMLYKPGPHTVSTFTTDFGVTFGMFICFDIAFQSPAVNILEDRNVTDIVYSTAWFGQLPFYIANSVQHSYAKLHGVNFLASGLNDPKFGMGGSGIYLADGSIVSQFVSGKEGSKLIIGTVPKSKSRLDLSNTCQHASIDSSSSVSTEIHNFHTNPTDLTDYTISSLNVNDLKVSETVCAKNSEFCCTFNVTFNKYLPGLPNYSYKLIAFDGISAVSKTKTAGINHCGLVACGNDSVASCTYRNVAPPTGIYFDHISVTGTFHNIDELFPSTVTYNLLPTTQYVYCKKTTKDQVEVSMYTTQQLDGLLTFGIFGRTFKNDDKPPGIANDGSRQNYGQFYWFNIMLFIFSIILSVKN